MKVRMFVKLKTEHKGEVILTNIIKKEKEFDDEVMDTDILVAVEDFLCDELTWGYDVTEDRKHIILPNSSGKEKPVQATS